MIGSIRKHIQGKGAKIILWLTLFSLAGGSFISLIRFSRRFGSVDALATVNDYDISVLEYRRKFLSLAHVIQEIKRLYGPQAEAILSLWGLSDKPEQAVLDNLIQEKATQSAADSLGGHVSKEYIAAKLKDPLFIRDFLADIVPPQAVTGGALNVDMLRYNLARQGMSEADFEDAVQAAVQRYLLDRLIEGSTYAPSAELKELYLRAYAKKKFGIIALAIEEYLKRAHAKKFSDAQVQDYFTQHKENYKTPERRDAKVWTFAYDVPVSDKEAESYYEHHKREFIAKPEEWIVERILLKATPETMVQKRGHAQELMKQVKENPTSFQAVAKQYSQAQEKGAPIPLTRAQMEPVVASTIATLTKGGISPVLEVADGFVIIKLLEKKMAEYKPFTQVKDDVKQKVKREKFLSDFSSNAQRVISQAADMPEVFKRFIEEKHAQESTIENGTLKEGTQAEKLFGLAKKGDRAFYTQGDKGYIIELTGIKESTIPELARVKDAVIKDMYQEEAQRLMKEDIKKARQNLTQGLDKAAQSIGAKSEITDWIDPQNQATAKKLEEKKIPLQRAFMLTKAQATVDEITDQGAYLIMLVEIEPLKEADFERKKPELQAYLASQEVPLIVKSFNDYVRAAARVHVNEELWHRASSRV